MGVLDECTNGISPDVEHDLYDRCTKLDLAVFSISHKIELKLFHDYELHYHGDEEGSWEMTRCSEKKGRVTKSLSFVRLPSFDHEITVELATSPRKRRHNVGTPSSSPTD